MTARVSRGLLALALTTSSCASHPKGEFVWVDKYEPAATVRGGTIRPGDLVDVRVLGQDQLSAKGRVRSDGEISLPFLGDLKAAGESPSALRGLIEERLKEFVKSPVVTVTLEEVAPAPISILGEVTRPGKYPYEPGMGLLDALAQVGGLTEYAHQDRLFVLREKPTPTRIRFDARLLLRGEGRGMSFLLEPGDVVVAE